MAQGVVHTRQGTCDEPFILLIPLHGAARLPEFSYLAPPSGWVGDSVEDPAA